ncbi:FtsJ-like methyltransferase-domain-containing protein [Pseudomassariella vexata]|uniref:rRNA methyltransferase 2, mitochondrial n=1 Tax=Pseudomassariella vexata TaxID=1141098 RepID=A0A1Y2E0A8_9PEZI|nr:FtsJ-like methyltransferase-domain-containing protein [Pseudomassariella vexata]ORY64973.1 FtsJ-like methyltransferase-domain-containing protein [Pseudomassariella vexata]
MARPAKPTKGREEHVNMAAEKQTQLLHELEMKHQLGGSRSDLLVKDEDVRRLKLRILMLRDENISLRDEITQNTDEHAKLAAKCEGLSSQLEAKIEVVRLQEKQLRKQEREFSSVKAELQLMNNLSQDSTNILSEKLALTRELAVLKPELEHLRSQLTQQQATLAEKLALERQVNTLEVELANEKKVIKRAMQKRESNDRVEDELRQKLREVEKNLAAERSQRERLEDQLAQEKQTRQLALQDQDSIRELESDLRKKLNDAQKQLREEREDKERLEEELRAEKQLAKKAFKKQASNSDEEELRNRLDEVESKLAAEQNEKEKVRNQAQTSLSEAETRNDSLEKKLEKLKTKLRETQDQLKQCQADLKKAQQTKPSVSEEVTKKTVAGRQVFKKRKGSEFATDDITQITIGTPGAEERPRRGAKKRSFETTLVGEKSTFSITPFLNRGKLVGEETVNPDESMEDSILGPSETTRAVEVTTTTVLTAAADDSTSSNVPPSEISGTVSPDEEQPAAEPKPQLKKPRGRPKKVLGDAPSAKKNAQPAPKVALKKKTPKASSTLDKVTEETEETEENEPNEPSGNEENKNEKTQMVKSNSTAPQDDNTVSATSAKTEEPKKKKRKVLGVAKPTLFEDEEVEPAQPMRKPAKTAVSGVKRAALGGKGTSNAFVGGASFSPLKKDRRGVGASFLACGRAQIRQSQEVFWMKGLSRIAGPLNGGLLRVASFAAAACSIPIPATYVQARWSSSNSRWKQRQGSDFYAREAKVQGLKSRAAFKLLEMDSKYHLFKKGQTVIDLGYAPGSWSQVALERTKPTGRVVGIDIIPAQPPKGVSTIQGNFLSPSVQNLVKEYLHEFASQKPAARATGYRMSKEDFDENDDIAALIREKSYIDTERADSAHEDDWGTMAEKDERLVDVVLSDMSAPWSQTAGFSCNTLSNPHIRMMNTSGMNVRDHIGSMDLCAAALQFASDTLATGGHFVAKFYQGSEDKQFEMKLKKMFGRVHREKPESSRTESREAYFVALKRKGNVTLADIEK